MRGRFAPAMCSPYRNPRLRCCSRWVLRVSARYGSGASALRTLRLFRGARGGSPAVFGGRAADAEWSPTASVRISDTPRYGHLPSYKAEQDVAIGLEKSVAGFGSRRVVEQAATVCRQNKGWIKSSSAR